MAEKTKNIPDLSKELKKEVSKETKPKKPKIPKITDSRPRATDDSDLNPRREDYLGMLKNEFLRAPFLALLEEYVKRCNPKGRSVGSSMHFFKADHKYVIRIVLFFDYVLLFIFLSIVLIVALRGLGLLNFSGIILK